MRRGATWSLGRALTLRRLAKIRFQLRSCYLPQREVKGVYKRHIASFNGLHNHSKSLVLLYLLGRRSSGLGGVTVRELALGTGVGYNSLKASMSKWTRWKYLTRRIGTTKSGMPIFVYSIAKRGLRFTSERIPPERRLAYASELAMVKTEMSELGIRIAKEWYASHSH